MHSTISSKGQVTVPAAVRQRLGLRLGTRVEFELRADGVLMRRVIPSDHPVDQLYGVLELERSVDETVDAMRGGPAPNKA